MHELTVRNQHGKLTAREKKELDAYCRIGLLLDLMKSNARLTLKRRRAQGNRRTIGGSNVSDDRGGSDHELQKELERRSAAFRSGSTTARPATDVLADLNGRQSREMKS
jgi:hypothetical protein